MNLRAGEGSDEWELNVALSEGLLAGKGHYKRELITEKYLEWIESNPKDMPVLMGIALSQLRKNTKRFQRREKPNLGNELLKDSLKNIKQESALGLIRLVPLVIWGLNLEDEEF